MSYKKILILSAIYIVGLKLNIAQQIYLPIVPQPQKIEFSNDEFVIQNQTIQLKLYCEQSEALKNVINELIDVSQKYTSSDVSINNVNDKIIHVGINNYDESFSSVLKKYNLMLDDSIGVEGYKLFISSNDIVVLANDNKGLFYGLQSLKQLVRASFNKQSLPGLLVTDYPSFKYRAISDDISRGPIPTMDYMKYQMRRLSEMKINTFIHYVEHVVKTKRYPEFAPIDGSFTIEEWKEIANYAIGYNITVIGGFQSFGHFKNILDTKEYAHLGESGSLISPVKPESYEFLENIYNEMIPAFHSNIFNINCDETFDLGKEESKKLVDSLGYAEVYFQHIMKLYNIVKKHDKRIIMWGDILIQYPELIKKIPHDVLIGTWNYDSKETFKEFIDPFRNSGHELWVVPGVLNSRRIYPDYDKAFGNIKVFVEEGYEAGATGVLNCFWDDGSTGLFSNDWYGAAYGADKSWNTYSNDSTFDYRYGIGSLAADDIHLFDAIRKINELRFYELTDGMTDKFLFVNLIPQAGEENKVSLADLEKCSTIVEEAKSELQKAVLLNYSEDVEYLKFIIDLYQILIEERFDLLKAADLYREAEKQIVNNPYYARKNILKALELVTKMISSQNSIKQQFELLWLRENHTYALDWITEKYDKKINDFFDVKILLLKSLKLFDSSKPILSISEVRLSISRLPGKYFTEWMMINPIPYKSEAENGKIDYLIDMGGEKRANPKVTQEFYYNNEKYRWRRVVSDKQDVINLNDVYDYPEEGGVIYAFANISVSEKKEVKSLVGFTDKIEVFMNGQRIFDSISDDFVADKQIIVLPLEKGKNNLLLKIIKRKGDWGFTFRLPDSRVRNSKNRYRIINNSNSN